MIHFHTSPTASAESVALPDASATAVRKAARSARKSSTAAANTTPELRSESSNGHQTLLTALSDRSAAMAFLKKAGIYTASGKLHRNFGG